MAFRGPWWDRMCLNIDPSVVAMKVHGWSGSFLKGHSYAVPLRNSLGCRWVWCCKWSGGGVGCDEVVKSSGEEHGGGVVGDEVGDCMVEVIDVMMDECGGGVNGEVRWWEMVGD